MDNKKLEAIFTKSWLTSGSTGDMIRNEEISVEDVRKDVALFVNSRLGRLVECAFDDFNEFIDKQFMHLKPQTPGFDRYVSQLQAERRYKEWFFILLHELRSFGQQHEAEVGNIAEQYV